MYDSDKHNVRNVMCTFQNPFSFSILLLNIMNSYICMYKFEYLVLNKRHGIMSLIKNFNLLKLITIQNICL